MDKKLYELMNWPRIEALVLSLIHISEPTRRV